MKSGLNFLSGQPSVVQAGCIARGRVDVRLCRTRIRGMNRVMKRYGNRLRAMAGQPHLPGKLMPQWPKRCARDLWPWRAFAMPAGRRRIRIDIGIGREKTKSVACAFESQFSDFFDTCH
jgi:hypothetical protein